MVTPTIFAMGGGGFTMEPENPALDEYVLSLAHTREPRILFLPTASGDGLEQGTRFHDRYDDRPCRTDVLELFRLGQRGPTDLRELVLSHDIVYVGGGSMRNLLAIWQVHGLDAILREAWQAGVILAGLSAGAMCWFQYGVTKSSGEPEPTPGLGFIEGSLTVHADGEPDRLPVYERLVAAGTLPNGYAADDGVGLLFRSGEMVEAVSSRPTAGAWSVVSDGNGGVVRTPLEVRRLAEHPMGMRALPGDVMEFRRERQAAAARLGR